MNKFTGKNRWKILMLEMLVVVIVILLCVLSVNTLLAKYPDFFYRDKPQGLCEAALSDKPNWVSSLVHRSNSHYVSPLPVTPLSDIARCIQRMDPQIYVVIHNRRIEGFRRTHYFGFTDWFCITDNGHITSSATLGYSDLGNNRNWVTDLRQQLSDYSCID
jgi:uncharacterized protein (DUF1499 family)